MDNRKLDDMIWEEDPYVFIFKDEIPGKTKMHVKNLDLHNWVRTDSSYPKQMYARKRLYETNLNDIFVSRVDDPKTDACKREFFQLLIVHLPERFPDIFEMQPNGFILNKVTGELISTDLDKNSNDEDLLLRAGRLTQEDWIIMELDPDHSTYVLTAGVLCFPSDWSLADKFNKPMHEIHSPVKIYMDKLQNKVDSLFLCMKPEKPLWRANWGIYSALSDIYDLFTHPKRQLHNSKGTSSLPFEGEATGKKLFLRCEYQTLRKLPKTGCIVFGIRTYMRLMEDLKDRPLDEVQSLIDSIEHLDPEYLSYKGGDVWKDASLQYLYLLVQQQRQQQQLHIETSKTQLQASTRCKLQSICNFIMSPKFLIVAGTIACMSIILNKR